MKKRFVYDGKVRIERGETGVVTMNGGDNATILLDKHHPDLAENSLFLPPPEWGIDYTYVTDSLQRDRLCSMRKVFGSASVYAVLIVLLLTNLGLAVADILMHDDALPAMIVRNVMNLDGAIYRTVLERTNDTTDPSAVIWRVLDRQLIENKS